MRKFRSLSLAAAALVAASLVSLPGSASAATRCSDTTPPSWFYNRLTNAANDDSSIPNSWGTSYDMARIACFESSYQVHAENGSYYGLGQMSKSLIASENVSWDHYWNGSADHHIGYYQLLAALRYCKERYGSPANAWSHEVNYGWW
ncbi:MAG TPA: hypothetical protein VMB79_00205 [Jatrophihabitans sp.]|nr:hypothetical protein [Jatrophihabitans sp.]